MDKNELLLFQAGNRQFGLSLLIVKSIHGANVFAEEQLGQEDAAVGIQPFLNQTRIRIPNTEFSVPLYNLSSILAEDSFLYHSGNNPVSEGEFVPDPGQTYPCSESGTGVKEKVMLLNVRNHPLALKVDRVDGVVSVESSQIEPLSPIFKGTSLDWFPQVLKRNGNLILILNPEGIEGRKKEDEEDSSTDLTCAIQTDAVVEEKKHTEPTDTASDIRHPASNLMEAVGTELDSEITLTPLLMEDIDPKKLEGTLTRIIKGEKMSDMVLQIFARQLEETVAQEIGKVKQFLMKKLLEKGLIHAEK